MGPDPGLRTSPPGIRPLPPAPLTAPWRSPQARHGEENELVVRSATRRDRRQTALSLFLAPTDTPMDAFFSWLLGCEPVRRTGRRSSARRGRREPVGGIA